jgi:hypothetical protein
VAERDGAAVRVDLRVHDVEEPQVLDARKRLRRERLVQLEELDVLDLHFRPRERLLHGRDRAVPHD